MDDNDAAGVSKRSTTTTMQSDGDLEKRKEAEAEDGGEEDKSGRPISSTRRCDEHIATQKTPISKYRNSLLAAVAYLDLANALDFPANVWNRLPTPFFAKVLLGVGGSIAILSTTFAFWDTARAWRNIAFLKVERTYLKEKERNGELTTVERAWLGVNKRELGWEIIDRMMLDVFMAIAGLLVGTGCLMAIKGDVPAVYLASNILSGYLGNSFVALYAVINTAWCVFMWRRAHACQRAMRAADGEVEAKMMITLKRHLFRHKLYAIVNGVTIFVSGVGSEISSTMWPGYVVLIPCIFGSVFCNNLWRFCLGYDRTALQQRYNAQDMDIRRRLQEVTKVREALMYGPAASIDCYEHISGDNTKDDGKALGFLHDLDIELEQTDFVSSEASDAVGGGYALGRKIGHLRAAINHRIQRTDATVFKHEARFLLELYGYYLLAREPQVVGEDGTKC